MLLAGAARVGSAKNAVAKLQTLIAENRAEFEPTPENARQIAFVEGWPEVPIGKTTPAPNNIINGKLFVWAESGTEGAYWALQDDRYPQSYEGLHVIETGDHLTIINSARQVCWAGIIEKDTATGARPHPGNPRFIQQAVHGWWAHWIQAGFEPDQWADFFDRTGEDAYHGILIKRTAA